MCTTVSVLLSTGGGPTFVTNIAHHTAEKFQGIRHAGKVDFAENQFELKALLVLPCKIYMLWRNSYNYHAQHPKFMHFHPGYKDSTWLNPHNVIYVIHNSNMQCVQLLYNIVAYREVSRNLRHKRLHLWLWSAS